MNAARLRRAAEREHQRRERVRRADPSTGFNLTTFAGRHLRQLAFALDRSRYIHVMCARQSGKSWGCDAIMLDNALHTPGSTNLLLGLTGVATRTNNWEVIWKPLCEKYGIPDEWHNEQRMTTYFPNGARVMFAGTDDMSHVKGYLGNRLAGGVVIIDESQDQKDSVLAYMLRQVLPPMLTPTTRVILAGVLPDVPAGLFYELAAEQPLREAPGLQRSKGWSHHEWAREDNVHTPEAMEQLADYMREHNVADDDPQILRDWKLLRVWHAGETAYKYRRAVAGYEPTPAGWLADLYATETFSGKPLLYCHPMAPTKDDSALVGLMAAEPLPGVDCFGFAIDPGAATDRVAIEGWGWGAGFKGVQHLFDWATPRGMNLTTGQIYAMAAVAQRHYGARGHITWRYDAGSSQNTVDNLERDYGIALMLAAKKADLKGQVDRNADLLTSGLAKVMIGGALEQDYMRARWDKDARKQQRFEWASAWHPDPSEAGRYGLQDYFDTHVPKDMRPRAEREREAFYADNDADLQPEEREHHDPLAGLLPGWR